MKRLLLTGLDAREHKDYYIDFSLALQKMGFEVSAYWLCDEAIEGEWLVEQLEGSNISSWYDTPDAIDWLRIEKEIKTHEIMIAFPCEAIAHLLNLAKVYGKDVWSLMKDTCPKSYVRGADFLIVTSDSCAPALLEEKTHKMVIIVDLINQCFIYYKNGIKRLFETKPNNFVKGEAAIEGFAIGWLFGEINGFYVEPRLQGALACSWLYPNINPIEMEQLMKTVPINERQD